ncbi:hypothetical protein ACVWWH_002106 [Sinomonas sp. RB5]
MTGTVACSATTEKSLSPASTTQGSSRRQLPQRGVPCALSGTLLGLPQCGQTVMTFFICGRPFHEPTGQPGPVRAAIRPSTFASGAQAHPARGSIVLPARTLWQWAEMPVSTARGLASAAAPSCGSGRGRPGHPERRLLRHVRLLTAGRQAQNRGARGEGRGSPTPARAKEERVPRRGGAPFAGPLRPAQRVTSPPSPVMGEELTRPLARPLLRPNRGPAGLAAHVFSRQCRGWTPGEQRGQDGCAQCCRSRHHAPARGLRGAHRSHRYPRRDPGLRLTPAPGPRTSRDAPVQNPQAPGGDHRHRC